MRGPTAGAEVCKSVLIMVSLTCPVPVDLLVQHTLDSALVQRLSTASQHSVLAQRFSTASQHSVLVQRLSKAQSGTKPQHPKARSRPHRRHLRRGQEFEYALAYVSSPRRPSSL